MTGHNRISRRRDDHASSRGNSRARLLSAALGLSILAALSTPAAAQVSIGIGFSIPGARIGISVPIYPDFVPVPGYPVYYAPQLDLNLFFYDGLYWSYSNDQWYSSAWYDGPWDLIGPEFVPLFVLRVPVRYYRRPPSYFQGWMVNEAPRWGDHWGRDWQQHRSGWDRWDRRSAPVAAPLPMYQREYRGNRYPGADQQRALREREYNYRPQDSVARQHFNASPQATPDRRTPAATERRDRPPNRTSPPEDVRGTPSRGNERDDASQRSRPQPYKPAAASPGETRREAPAPSRPETAPSTEARRGSGARPEAQRPAKEPTRAATPTPTPTPAPARPAERAREPSRARPDNAPRSQPEQRRGPERAADPERSRERPSRGGGNDDPKPDGNRD